MAGAHPRRVLIGVGNLDRGDDAAGRMLARRLVGALPEDVEITELNGEATALMARLQGADTAILVDASSSGARAGTVRRFDVGERPLPEGTFGLSTHGFGVNEAIELARALGDLPARCIVYAIEGASFEPGAPLSAPVATAIEEIAKQLCAKFACVEQPEGPEPCMKPH